VSTRVLAQTQLSAACQQLARQQLNLADAATLDLSGVRQLALSSQRLDLPAVREMISSSPLSLTLETLAPLQFGTVRQLLASPSGAGTAASAQAALASALSTASTTIGSATRDITAGAFAEAGAELGYAVSVCRGEAVTGIELRRGHELVLMRVSNGGGVESDHAGLVDATCGDRQRELEQAAARRGITITHCDQSDHASAQGGILIRNAAARRDPSLARAVTYSTEQAASSRTRRVLAEEPARRATRRAGGQA
jgi:hypothetical protein